MREFVVGFSLAATMAYALPAGAYNNREHERLPDQAVQIANILNRGDFLTTKVSKALGTSVAPLSSRPASIPESEQTRWNIFVDEARAMPALLGQIRTGLADPRVPGTECGNVYPVTTGAHLAQCKGVDLPFAVKRGWASNTSDCFVRGNYFPGDSDTPEFFNDLPADRTGALLGYYAQNVDDEVNDSKWWFSFSNAGFASTVQSVADDASDFTMAILLAPFACVWAFFSGENCGDKAEQWGHSANPVTRTDEFIKDFEKALSPDMDGDDLFSTTGVWHFINVEAANDGEEGQFNSVGGMHYDRGGWRGGADIAGVGRIDLLDWGIIVLGDASGFTIDPDEALGVQRYTQSPDGRLERVRDDWFKNIGHIEFEPLDNLALYGWRRFQSDHDASGLGWALHAIGDAVAPHHGIAATGWGHRPFEDFASFAWGEMFSEGDPRHYVLMQDILLRAYSWWKFIDDAQANGSPNDIPIRDLVTELAFDTRSVSDYAFKNGISVLYGDSSDEAAARGYYGDTADQTEKLLANGTGATMAFLIKAAKIAAASPDDSPDPCACPAGQSFLGGACRPCAQQNQVEVDGHCIPTCPEDVPILDSNGHCDVICATPPCSGKSCSRGEFLQGSQCVDECSGTTPVAVGRECRADCPPGYVQTTLSGSAFCERFPLCTASPNTGDSIQICCPSDEPFITQDTASGDGGTASPVSVCVATCPFEASFFELQAGQPSICKMGCTSGKRYFVPQEGPHECLAGCPVDKPFAVSTTSGQACEAVCPAAAPFYTASPIVGTTFQCVAECTKTVKATVVPAFHFDSGQCVDMCPAFFLQDRQCVAACPGGPPPRGGSECPPVGDIQ